MADSDNPFSEKPEPESTGPDFSADSNIDHSTEKSASEIDGILNEAVRVAEEGHKPRTERVRPPGPGLFESICWMFGVIGAHFAGIMIFTVGAIVYLLLTSNLEQNAKAIQKQLTQYFEDHALEMAGVEQGIFVLIVMLAVGLRLGKGVFGKLNIQPFAVSTGFLLLISVFPLSLLSGELYRLAFEVWSAFVEQVPSLKAFDEMQAMEMVKQMAENSSLGALILVIAVFPAIGEELVFRGAIGRGLIARWGLVPGMIITSIMFGLVHVHPAHVMAVIPLGMFMHYVYYVTRSFWAPVLVHFMNNAFAVTVTKLQVILPEEAVKLGDETQAVHPLITLSAALFVTIVCVYLWKSRSKYLNPDGSEWSPGYISNESPPPEKEITFERQRVAFGFYPALLLLIINFVAMMAFFGFE
ncbi:MAG: CPBP family intramembrane metalloprotease [Planctomycetes bacterium]|nr:CPBP family intramembrane metalloprotease [Planctomycetota bacterium]MCH9726303.1 CPBP family intramembrane metalloprotease [Planctomycetota bacterium]MCH9776419.1 CPBP family intramembrane metalloprotease [Planctomycetota bacterium]MCH9791089.1 CPBP family intramembrane metalloprotease [Planctomycetota bacterium]MDF1746458.1 type II CAAX endopeptidase family protein [Gimesia sp.]